MEGSVTYSESFWTALATLHVHGIEAQHAGYAIRLWFALAQRNPTQPDVSLDEGVRFSWYNRYSLEVDVLDDARMYWYFRDSSLPIGESEGATEEPVAELPDRFWECLTLAGNKQNA